MTSVDQAATGWRLVPVEATEEMVDAGIAAWPFEHDAPHTAAYRMYSAMLSAAPQPGVTAGEVVGALWAMVEHFERVDGDARHKAVIERATRALSLFSGDKP